MTRGLKSFSILLLFLSFSFSGCSETSAPPVQDQSLGLKDKYRDHFLVGSMIQDVDIAEAPGVVEKHCSIVTVNHFYWRSVHPAIDVYDFASGDRRVSYASENDMKVRGHPLLFGTVDPDWVFVDGEEEASREVLIERMKDHIQTVVSRYKGKIHYWDVVNEPTADIFFNLGDEPSSIRDTYKRHKWYTIIGEEYVELALRFAHEADPEAKLYVNENNIVGPLGILSRKRRNFLNIIKDLQEKEVPLHGIGIQGHWSHDYPRAEDVVVTVELFSSLGLDVQITELDMSTYSIVRWALPELVPVHEAYTPSIEQKQTERYDAFFEVFRRCSDQLSAVVFWGLSDPTSWLTTHPDERDDWPLLFDENYAPKQAYRAVVDF
jgi:endo-1,4-beta-xylanase